MPSIALPGLCGLSSAPQDHSVGRFPPVLSPEHGAVRGGLAGEPHVDFWAVLGCDCPSSQSDQLLQTLIIASLAQWEHRALLGSQSAIPWSGSHLQVKSPGGHEGHAVGFASSRVATVGCLLCTACKR